MSTPNRRPARLERALLCLFVLALAAVPLRIVGKAFTREHGLLELPLFGQVFLPRALPEVRAIDPPVRYPDGYDGQFYAQLALDPGLGRPELRTALDTPGYRARRIGLPALAHLLGLGRPGWTLQVYSALNLAFWGALLLALARRFGFTGLRERLLAASLLCTAGTCISIERALTDLPALVVSFCGLLLVGSRRLTAGALLGAAALFKEASALSFPALAWIDARRPARQLIWSVPVLVAPALLWNLYVRWMLPTPGAGLDGLGIPLVGLCEKIMAELGRIAAGERNGWVELGCTAAIATQVAYLAWRPRLACSAWRWGAGFALLALCLASSVWTEQFAYTRNLLPLTAAFNLLVYQRESGRAHLAWFVLGNAALFNRALVGPVLWLAVAWIALELWNRSQPGVASAASQIDEA